MVAGCLGLKLVHTTQARGVTMTLGAKVKQLRRERHWRQIDLAVHAGVRQSLISELEHGRKDDTTGHNLLKLARALDVSVNYLLTSSPQEDATDQWIARMLIDDTSEDV
jgi:transcriptional regulator with XRE-family HTH domain